MWLRRAVAVGLLGLGLAAGYMLWLRDSSLVEVREVEVRGATADTDRVTAALEEAALRMTTLHVRMEELQEAVAPFPTVAALAVDASPPHRLEITVRERVPIALAADGERRIPVAADGILLRGLRPGRRLPELRVGSLPGGATLDREGGAQAAVLGAAPPALLEHVAESTFDPDRGGVVAQLRGGPELRFGDPSRAEAKWAAAAAVIADPEGDGRSYIDVSIPARPVAGG